MIRLENIHMQMGDKLLLENETIEIHEGYLHVIMGESGSGKTTLLHEISLLSSISECTYIWNDRRIDKLRDYDKADIRRNNIGYILQDLELISEELSLRDNLVCMSSLAGRQYNEEKAREYMRKLNLYSSLDQSIESMSRGERQRFALVLALMKDAELIICDEPTSALDIENSHELMEYLQMIARDYHKMIVIATHDDIVADYADRLYCIRNHQLITDRDTDIKVYDVIERKSSYADKQFYKTYTKGYRKLSKAVMKIIYVLMIAVLCLAPVMLDYLLDRQQELFEMFADSEIIVSNTDERMPYSTYNALYDDIGQSTADMLREIDNVSDVRYYWEMDGSVISGSNSIPVRIIPKDTETIKLSSALSKKLGSDTEIDFYLDYDMKSYEFHLDMDEYMAKDYPPRRGIDKEVIYVPYDMIAALLQKHDIKTSSSISVVCEDVMKVEETIRDIERWMNNATVSSESIQYLDSIKTLENIQKYITVLRIVLIAGITAVAYIVNEMENKARRREITTLRINGFDRMMFYRLSFYENKGSVFITAIAVMTGYIIFVAINKLDIRILNMMFLMGECIVYVIITKIVPIFVSGIDIFKKEISTILREY